MELSVFFSFAAAADAVDDDDDNVPTYSKLCMYIEMKQAIQFKYSILIDRAFRCAKCHHKLGAYLRIVKLKCVWQAGEQANHWGRERKISNKRPIALIRNRARFKFIRYQKRVINFMPHLSHWQHHIFTTAKYMEHRFNGAFAITNVLAFLFFSCDKLTLEIISCRQNSFYKFFECNYCTKL